MKRRCSLGKVTALSLLSLGGGKPSQAPIAVQQQGLAPRTGPSCFASLSGKDTNERHRAHRSWVGSEKGW